MHGSALEHDTVMVSPTDPPVPVWQALTHVGVIVGLWAMLASTLHGIAWLVRRVLNR